MAKLRQKYREVRASVTARLRWLAHTFEGRPTNEMPLKTTRRRKRLAHYLYNLVFAISVAFIVARPGPRTPQLPDIKEGQIVDRDWASPITADIEPREAKKGSREELAKRVAPIFDYDDALLENWLRNWQQAFRRMRADFYLTPKTSKRAGTSLESVNQRIFELTGQSLSADDLLFLHQRRFSVETENTFVKIAEYLLGRLISPTDLFPSHYSTGIVVRQVNQDLNETLIYDLSRIWSLEQAREFLAHVPELLKANKASAADRVVEVVNNLILPNLKYNPALTEKRVATLLAGVKPIVQSVKRGQLLFRKGERLNEAQAELLANLRELMSPSAIFQRFILIAVILLVFFGVMFRMELTRRGFWHLTLKDSLFFMGLAILTIVCAKYSLPFLRLFFGPFNLRYGVEYILPISAGGIIIHLVMGKESAFTFALLVSTVLGILLDRSYFFTVWALMVSVSAIQSIRACKQRTDLYKCGIWSGTVGAMLVAAYCFTQYMGFKSIDWMDFSITVSLAFLSGLIGAVLAGALVPIFEAVFGYTTSLKLLELSNFNHPLLHNLMMKAPGTYHHSVIVGSLAEIAADRVKANALLARVSAYYHDIGKMTKPMYFIENQSLNNNPHDHLTPSMSAKILFSHVKNGVRMARDYNLGAKITNIIEQHHGTTLVSYFFNKAKKAEKPEHDHVQDSEFRYPGPRPQSREAAIVMLADACEAATRSINEPTPAKIQAMVHNIINRRFLEEQFAECDLTFSDLQVIEESFTRTLVSLYHHRIEYPGQKKTLPRLNHSASPNAAPFKKSS